MNTRQDKFKVLCENGDESIWLSYDECIEWGFESNMEFMVINENNDVVFKSEMDDIIDVDETDDFQYDEYSDFIQPIRDLSEEF